MPRKKKEITTTKPKTDIVKYHVIRDIQEKKGFWEFPASKYCDGLTVEHLVTADYTLRGYEHIFAIERKASTGELAGNITTKQFENELSRGEHFRHFFIICEFRLEQILQFPYQSTIPKAVWPKLKITAQYFLKRIIQLEMKYKVKFIFADNAETAKTVARAIFREMVEKYGEEVNGKIN